MEFFDRDDLKKALVYLLPVLAVVIIIVFAARLPSSDKKDDSSSKAYSYGSSEMPFSMTISGERADLAWSDEKLRAVCGTNFSTEQSNYAVLISHPEEVEDGLSVKTFTVNNPGYNGSKIMFPQGFTLGEDEANISNSLSEGCIKEHGNNRCSYYMEFFLDGKEIDYSKMDYSIADDEGPYMSAMLKGAVCELYCKDQIAEGKAKICTGITITTAEERCDSCTIKIIKPQDLVIDEGGY